MFHMPETQELGFCNMSLRRVELAFALNLLAFATMPYLGHASGYVCMHLLLKSHRLPYLSTTIRPW